MKKLISMLVLILSLMSCREEKMVQSTIVSHEVVSNKEGGRTYITIVKTDDGYVEEMLGLSYYAIPVGTKVKVKVWR